MQTSKPLKMPASRAC